MPSPTPTGTRDRARAVSSVWASAQSEPVTSRDELEARVAEVESRFADVEVPRPDGWGGFRVVPDEIEFWQHRDDRLHDRFVYTRPHLQMTIGRSSGSSRERSRVSTIVTSTTSRPNTHSHAMSAKTTPIVP